MPQLKLHAVCAWSLHRLDCILDNASMWLTDAEATAVVEIPDTNLSYITDSIPTKKVDNL